MQASQFRKLAAYLLQTHYGLDLDDTTLSEDYSTGVAQGDRIFLLINMLSNKYDLHIIHRCSAQSAHGFR